MADDDDDFRTRAAAAAARIAASNPAEVLAQNLATDRPTIESAVKSFLSLTAARSLTTKTTTTRSDDTNTVAERCAFSSSADPRLDALRCARVLLRRLDDLTLTEDDLVPGAGDDDDDDRRLEADVLRTIWNGLIASEKKPTRFLGRSSLARVFPVFLRAVEDATPPEGVAPEDAAAFFREFGALSSRPPAGTDDDDDDDGALLWAEDRGVAELAKRRERREQRKLQAAAHAAEDTTTVVEDATRTSSVVIEEIVEE